MPHPWGVTWTSGKRQKLVQRAAGSDTACSAEMEWANKFTDRRRNPREGQKRRRQYQYVWTWILLPWPERTSHLWGSVSELLCDEKCGNVVRT